MFSFRMRVRDIVCFQLRVKVTFNVGLGLGSWIGLYLS